VKKRRQNKRLELSFRLNRSGRALEHDPEKHASGYDPAGCGGFPKRSCLANS
jgi:hypothetical protein